MRLVSILALAASAYSASAVAQPADVPPDLNRFGLICFCSSRVATPHMVIGYDSNGRLLYLARNGATREQLSAAGVPPSESQVRLLKDWGLLREKNKVLTTAFPVLEPDSMATLRERLRPVANRLVPRLGPHVASIKRELARRGQGEAAYALLFSYVLDGLVWDQLRSSGKLPKTDITIERPYWAGTFWAVYPKQDAMPGTNTRSHGRVALKMMWNPRVLEPINDFYGAAQTGRWIEAVAAGAGAPQLFAGAKARPVLVREETSDPLFAHGSAIARPIAQAMLATDLSAELPAADESQRLLIGTHELIWLVLADLAAAHRISPPSVLTVGAKSSSDLAPLVIAVVSAGDKPSTP